jgi:hypothetical protein
MTQRLLAQYFRDRSFYQLQAGQMVDNPGGRGVWCWGVCVGGGVGVCVWGGV